MLTTCVHAPPWPHAFHAPFPPHLSAAFSLDDQGAEAWLAYGPSTAGRNAAVRVASFVASVTCHRIVPGALLRQRPPAATRHAKANP